MQGGKDLGTKEPSDVEFVYSREQKISLHLPEKELRQLSSLT